MKTRSQTKKEKLEKENEKIPQLNEDVLGIILKHVVRMETNEVLKSFEVIKEHYSQFLHPDDGPGIIHTPFLNHVEWPNYLDSNSRRLVYHTKAKLLSNRKLSVHEQFDLHVTSKAELNLLWKTFKHFPWVRHTMFGDNGDDDYWYLRMAFYFQILWRKIRIRGSLFEKLKQDDLP